MEISILFPPRRLKGLLPKNAIVAHKTGTSGANASSVYAATNDTGLSSHE